MRSLSPFAAARAATALSFVCVAAAAQVCAASTEAPPEARAAVDSTLSQLVRAVTQRDMERALAVFAPDTLLLRETRSRYAAYFALDSLSCTERLGPISMHGDTARVLVCEEIDASEHGRPQVDYGWRSRDLLWRDGGWRVIVDREEDCAAARFTELGMALDPEAHRLTARARLVLEVTNAGADELFLLLNRGLAVQSIKDEDGASVPFTRRADCITVPLKQARAVGDSIALTLDYEGELFNEAREQGYSQVGIASEGSFASWVTNWYPRVRGASSKSRGRLSYSVPRDITVASSGRLLSSKVDGERSRQLFEVNSPLDFSFAAARYFHRSERIGGVDVGVFFLQGGEEKAQLYIENCARILAFLEETYGFYPFDSYAVVEIPSGMVGTLGGSSEQGMNLFPAGGLPDTTFPLPLLGHEIGHSWWGNWVSGGSAAILDEGLAQMTAVLCVEEIAGEASMRRFLRRGFPNYRQSAEMYFRRFGDGAETDLPTSALAAGSDQSAALHDLADVKGFFTYEMLREEIGQTAFLAGLRSALAIYGRRTMTLQELRREWEASSGRDLGWFFEQWFERTGAPDVDLAYSIRPLAGGDFEVEGRVKQIGDLYRLNAEIVAARDAKADTTFTLSLTARETPFRFTSSTRPDTLLLDPSYKILRWTDDFRGQSLLARARSFHNVGDVDSAMVALQQYLARTPRSLRGLAERGLWDLEAGRIDHAKSELQSLLGRMRVWPNDDPTEARCELGLGKIADLELGRDEALPHYQRALDRTDDPTIRAEAARLLKTAYLATDDDMSVDPALAARCVGTYAVEPGLSLTVTTGQGRRLRASTSRGQIFGLKHVEGTVFTAVGMSEWRLEFETAASPGESTGFGALTLNSQGRVFHLVRSK